MQAGEREGPEFDLYADAYTTLLQDPIRDRFTHDPLHFHKRKWLLIERLLRRTGANPKEQRWLDVGCGRGELLGLGGANFVEAMGCDPSAAMLASCRSLKIHEQPSSVELPFENDSIDFVTAVCVYHHVHGSSRALLTREIMRVLTPGGLCCIIEHNPWNPLTRAIVSRCAVDVDAELLSGHAAGMLLQQAGFERVSLDYFLYLPEQLFKRLNVIERMLSKIPLGGQYVLLARAPA